MTKTTEGYAAAIPLLKEYTDKLMKLDERMGALVEKASSMRYNNEIIMDELRTVQTFYQRLLPGVKTLAQRVSQRLEHSKLDEMEQLELKLRLSELEAALALLDKRNQNIARM